MKIKSNTSIIFVPNLKQIKTQKDGFQEFKFIFVLFLCEEEKIRRKSSDFQEHVSHELLV